jgi:TRAP-type C4-dicarboxylate transport system permease small subunit
VTSLIDAISLNLARLGAFLGAFVLVLMMFWITASSLARTIFDTSLFDAVTPSRLAMTLIVFSGLAWAMRTEQHVRVGLLRGLMPTRARITIRAVMMTFAVGALLVLIFETSQFAYAALRLNDQIIGDITWPAFPFQAVIPIGLTLLFLESVRDLYRDVQAARGRGLDVTELNKAEDADAWN